MCLLMSSITLAWSNPSLLDFRPLFKLSFASAVSSISLPWESLAMQNVTMSHNRFCQSRVPSQFFGLIVEDGWVASAHQKSACPSCKLVSLLWQAVRKRSDRFSVWPECQCRAHHVRMEHGFNGELLSSVHEANGPNWWMRSHDCWRIGTQRRKFRYTHTTWQCLYVLFEPVGTSSSRGFGQSLYKSVIWHLWMWCMDQQIRTLSAVGRSAEQVHRWAIEVDVYPPENLSDTKLYYLHMCMSKESKRRYVTRNITMCSNLFTFINLTFAALFSRVGGLQLHRNIWGACQNITETHR